MADVTVPTNCMVNAAATLQAQGVLNGAVNGTTGAGIVSKLALEARNSGQLPNQVINTLRCTHDEYKTKGDPRAEDIRTAGNMYSVLSGGTVAGFR